MRKTEEMTTEPSAMAFAPVCVLSAASPPARPKASASPRRPRAPPVRLNLRDPRELDAELRRFSLTTFQDEDVLPRARDLLNARRGDLRYAITRYHGGFRALRLARQRAARAEMAAAASEPAFAALARKIRTFIESELAPLDDAHAEVARSMFPTHAALRAAGRNDIVKGVRSAGGSRAVALRMGLRLHYHATTDYTGERGRLLAELRRFVTERGNEGVFPTAGEMHEAGRLDLLAGLRAHGGSRRLADEMGLRLQRGRPRRDADGLRRSLEALGAASLPADGSLAAAGRVDALAAIRGLGGREAAAAAIGVEAASDPARTFFDEALFSLEACPDEAILVHNSGNKVRQMEDRAPVEERGGGGGALLPREGGRRRERHYFAQFDRLRQELLCFIFDDGVAGVMPTAQELIKAGRRDLVRACQLHGGQKTVAARLGLLMHSMGRKKILERVAVTVSE